MNGERILNIVIVEDETNIRECLVHLFPWDSLGIQVLASFAGGQEAFYYIMSHDVDIVLTDIRLQGMTGLDMVKMLRENDNRVAVIILTGYRQFQYMQQSIRYRVNDFLLKPIKYEELTASLVRIREELGAPVTKENSTAGSEHRLVQAVKSYLQAHIPDATLEQAAVTVGLSPSYLSRLFHKDTGETFSDHLMRLRMEKAGALLKKQEYRLYEIALQAGYDNPKNFSRAFRNYYGMTPSQYRESGGE